MEEVQQQQAMLPIDHIEQSEGGSIPGILLGDGISRLQLPTTPWFGFETPGSSARSPWHTAEMLPLQFAAPSTVLEGHPASVQNVSPLQGQKSPIPDSMISPALFGGVSERSEYPRLSVIIPTRNEAANLPYVLPRIPYIIDEVILVDGQSTDGSIEVAQRLLPAIRVIEQKGKGKGDAIRAGLEVATGDIIVLLDADGSADPQEIPNFVEALLADNDFAKGSRFAKGGGSHDITTLRRIGNHGLSRLVNILFGTRFSDLCYGYNAFWKHCLDHMAIDSDGFEVETLINIQMHRAGLKIAEVPSFEHRRIHGTSNLNTFRDGWRVLKTILRERMKESFPPPLQVEPASSVVEYELQSKEIVL